MDCTKLERIDEDAIKAAKIDNAKPERLSKVVAYKCPTCHKYHVGRNGKPLSYKDKLKYQNELALEEGRIAKNKEELRVNPYRDVKVVGFVDLSKIRY